MWNSVRVCSLNWDFKMLFKIDAKLQQWWIWSKFECDELFMACQTYARYYLKLLSPRISPHLCQNKYLFSHKYSTLVILPCLIGDHIYTLEGLWLYVYKYFQTNQIRFSCQTMSRTYWIHYNRVIIMPCLIWFYFVRQASTIVNER